MQNDTRTIRSCRELLGRSIVLMLAGVVVGLALSGPSDSEAQPHQPTAEQEQPTPPQPRDFTPAEEVSDDQAVAFPVDI